MDVLQVNYLKEGLISSLIIGWDELGSGQLKGYPFRPLRKESKS